MGTVHLNAAGEAQMHSLVAAGKVSDTAWDLSTEERNGLDPNMFLGVDTSFKRTDDGYHKYPFGKGGSVNRKALASIEGYATKNGEPEIASAAHAALEKADKKSMAEDTTGFLRNVEIFGVGTWRARGGAVKATPEMLAQIVKNFNSINQVPGYGVALKLGHADVDGAPAYGWMETIRSDGKTLTADFSDVPTAIIDAIGKRRYNSVSVELYPRVEYQGKVSENVLGAVALLGAEWPAVKGLRPLSAATFAGAGEKLELSKEQDVANEAISFTQAQSDAFVLAAETKVRAEFKVQMDEATAKVKAAEDRATLAETALKTIREDAVKGEVDAIIKAGEAAGKIVPANKVQVQALAEAVVAGSKPETRAGLLKTFSDFVNGQETKVKFSEKGAGKGDDGVAQGQKTADVIDAKAKTFLKEDKTGKQTYAQAVEYVLKNDDDLRHAYAAGE